MSHNTTATHLSEGLVACGDSQLSLTFSGVVTAAGERRIRAAFPKVAVGAMVRHLDRIIGQIVTIQDREVSIAPLRDDVDVAVGDALVVQGGAPSIICGNGLLGRVVDPLCEPLDDRGPIANSVRFALDRKIPSLLRRPSVSTRLDTGIRVVDSMFTLGKGQRIGIFSGPGQGKSSLLAMLANGVSCDVNVICLVGERGREVGGFVDETLGATGMRRSVVVVASADTPPAMRLLAMRSATAMAEWFREQGKNVLLLVDSLTRAVRAKRELDDIDGGEGGYRAKTFAFLPPLMERATIGERGSITGVYTVLSERQYDDPVVTETRSLLDGHIVLCENRAAAGKWPSVDVPASVSRVFDSVATPEHQRCARLLRQVIAAYHANEELVLLGAYREGVCRFTDAFLTHRDAIESFLQQDRFTQCSFADMMHSLKALVRQMNLPEE